MKRLRIIVLIVGLIAVYAVTLFVPTVTVQATYPSQTAAVNYTFFAGFSQKCITKGSISFSLDYKLNQAALIFSLITLATVCISLKKGRILGACLFLITFILLTFHADITVFSQELKNESHEVNQNSSLFMIVHICTYFILYFVQGMILKKERLLDQIGC